MIVDIVFFQLITVQKYRMFSEFQPQLQIKVTLCTAVNFLQGGTYLIPIEIMSSSVLGLQDNVFIQFITGVHCHTHTFIIE